MLAASLPSRTLRLNKGISLWIPRAKTNTGTRASHSCDLCICGITSHSLSIQPFQLLPSRNICRHISLTWPLPIDTSMPDGQSNNQSIKFLQLQYPWQSQAQWRDSRISLQQQNRRNSSVTSTGHRACWYLWWSIDVMKLLHRWCGWTPIQLLRH